ncbi:MAG: hypothetical protein ACI3XR_01075 [Eubacteriales bacterium]
MQAKFPLIWLPMAILAALVSAAGLLPLSYCIPVPLIALHLLLNLPLFVRGFVEGGRMRGCLYGNLCLRAFCLSVSIIVAVQIGTTVCFFPTRRYGELIASLAVAILVEGLIFWIGIIAVYCISGRIVGIVSIFVYIILHCIKNVNCFFCQNYIFDFVCFAQGYYRESDFRKNIRSRPKALFPGCAFR